MATIGVISVFVQLVALALWRRVQHANAPSALQNRDDSHENRDHPYCLDLFEARYGDQIHRYYQDRSRDNLLDPQDPSDWGDLPF